MTGRDGVFGATQAIGRQGVSDNVVILVPGVASVMDADLFWRNGPIPITLSGTS